MQQDIITLGLDLAKTVFQVHAIGADDEVLVNRQLRRAEVLKFFSSFPPCLVGLEACASAHHLGRERPYGTACDTGADGTTIIGNTARGLMQGIFLSDPGQSTYDRLVIRNNNLELGMYHGITVVQARDSVITGNTVRAVPGAKMLSYPFHPVTPWIKAVKSENTLICGNTIETPRASQDIGRCPASLRLPAVPQPTD